MADLKQNNEVSANFNERLGSAVSVLIFIVSILKKGLPRKNCVNGGVKLTKNLPLSVTLPA